MKKIMTLSICLLVAATSFASDFARNTSSNFDGRKDKEITLTLDNVEIGQQLYIKDNKGYILYNKTFKSSGSVNSTFDFSTLPNGTYFFEHEKSNQIKVIPFNVKTGEVTYSPDVKVIFKPVVKIKDHRVYLSKLELDKTDVTVSLSFENEINDYKVIHTENFKNTANIQRVYSLAENVSGNYKVVIKADGKEFVEYFSI
ncbi:hypothetical protein [Formosa algae]|uniref:Secretion system C-terminal sorting domain-containing protein n=1 Tax=Formosa algae TaxID=225843 RepID=A0A9X0YKB9_9FLAO|nr:hypothetical protein [Formosa algae]MBP1838506.1 hypothetical protein [Formosa algae]PNW30208.1 hypothetical protein BKP44_00705 [Formosa algae]